jgi:beta-phosphoglucomutase
MTNGSDSMAVIFDLDGVLVDTGWAHLQAWQDLAARERFEMTERFFKNTFGMQNYQIIPMLLPGISAQELKRMSDWKEQRYRDIIAERLTPADGVVELLNTLKRTGFRLAVGSSAPRANLELMLKGARLTDYFDACVSGEDVAAGKPDPATFLKAAERLSITPRRCAIVEDAVQGVQAGKAAGMAVVAVTSTRDRRDLAAADLVVDSLTELEPTDFLHLITNGNR